MLKFYQKVSRSPKLLEMVGLSPDINRIELGDLMRAWLDWKDKDLESERKRQERAKKEGARLIYNQDGYKVIQVGGTGTDPELASIAACIYGKNTKWCTSNEETAKGYLRRGPLYIVIKDGKNVLQTNLREFKDPQNVDINILKNQEFTQVLIDSGVFSDPKKVWDVIGTIGLQQHQRWPLVEPILAQDAWVACEYARLINEPFPLGEEVIARDTDASFLYAIGALNRRFPAGEAAIKRDPEKWGTYQKYFDTLEKIGQEPTR
jgi:hypothetical protein